MLCKAKIKALLRSAFMLTWLTIILSIYFLITVK